MSIALGTKITKGEPFVYSSRKSAREAASRMIRQHPSKYEKWKAFQTPTGWYVLIFPIFGKPFWKEYDNVKKPEFIPRLKSFKQVEGLPFVYVSRNTAIGAGNKFVRQKLIWKFKLEQREDIGGVLLRVFDTKEDKVGRWWPNHKNSQYPVIGQLKLTRSVLGAQMKNEEWSDTTRSTLERAYILVDCAITLIDGERNAERIS